MHHEHGPAATHPVYIFKVLAGLLAMGLLGLCAVWLPVSGATPAQQSAGVAVLVVLALTLVPAIQWVVSRRDELQRLQHQQASAGTITVLASAFTVVGILQANQWLPLFNQFWTLGLLLAVWGMRLMWADRRFR
ncbi:MAG: hypothetical protein V4627_18715 [Pseudomonadota bacterium]